MAAAPSHRRGPRFAEVLGGGAYDLGCIGEGGMGRAAATAGGRGGGAGERGGGAMAVGVVSSRGDSPRSAGGGLGALGKARIVAFGSKSRRGAPCELAPPGRSWKWRRRSSSGGRLRAGSSGSGSSQ